MPTKRQGWGGRLAGGLGGRIFDWAVDHWKGIVTFVATVAVPWALSLTQELQQYAPFSYAVVALGTAVVTGLGIGAASALRGWGRWRSVRARYAEKFLDTATVNPLEGNFERKRMKVTDFYTPYGEAIVGAKFANCELLGPGSIYIKSGQVPGSRFEKCEIVIVKDNCEIIGATWFDFCGFHHCAFIGVTLYMLQHQYQQMRNVLGDKTPPVISRGGGAESEQLELTPPAPRIAPPPSLEPESTNPGT